LPEGKTGELVITCLTKEAVPLIRYRTRDICSITYEKCKCGRTHARLTKLHGRSDDMLIIRGVNVFPSQIEAGIMSYDNSVDNYLIKVSREDKKLDKLEIQIEENSNTNDKQYLSKLQKNIESYIGVNILLTILPGGTLERCSGKAKRVIDLRNI
jgi:phenylacetate-CoA ligase